MEYNKIVDTSEVFCDHDEIYEYNLKKVNSNNVFITYKMQLLKSIEETHYYLFIDKSFADPSLESFHSDIEAAMLKFRSIFHDLTGNCWHLKEHFVHVPEHYEYIYPNELNPRLLWRGRFQSFPGRFLQTLSWKRSGTDRIFPVQSRPESTQISMDPVAGMIDLEVHYDMVDLAILKLSKPLKNLSHRHEFVKPGFNSPSCKLTSVINSKLYLVCYNGELTEDSDVKPYKYIHGLKNISTDQFNFCHNSNYKSVSVGSIVHSHDLPHLSTYATHTCSTLPGFSGGAIFDSYGNFTGIHIGVANSRQSKNREMFFSNDTYNKYIPVKSKAFVDFINQSVLTNMTDVQFAECWRTDALNTMQEETYIEKKMINNGQKLIGPIFDEAAQANILHQPAVRVMDKHS
ncbi:unnamed protein product [Adineta ricciae]|uniref:WGR domain-containing protein n=1 Tax=Adineta ricciae TaxID=249248 RepID=A0A815MDJ4_ADIRI|nr:unnamed protein product [Adineta ricciae]